VTKSVADYVTEEEVHAAANELDGKGVKVAIRAVRDHMRRGSFTTISRYLESWEPRLDEIPAAHPCPQSVIDAAARAADQTWKLAEAAAAGVFAEQKRTLEEELARASEAVKEAMEERKALLEENLDFIAQAEALVAERDGLKQQVAHLGGQISALKTLSQPVKRKPGPKPGFQRKPKIMLLPAPALPNG
jgi:hypothetical protein